MSRVLVTTGEPAGIGPELLVRLAQRQWPCALAAIGDADLLQQTAARLQVPLQLQRTDSKVEWPVHQPGHLLCIPVPLTTAVVPGQLAVANAPFVVAQLQQAADAALAGDIDAIVTNPVHKGIINDSGLPFTGHTEFFAACAGVAAARRVTGAVAGADAEPVPVLMLLATEGLRVALATTHLPLRAVADAITAARLRHVLQLLARELRQRFALSAPRIAVLGLNPHAGEGGHLGDEEIRVIEPVIRELQAQGLNLIGPLSADTAFNADKLPQFDAYLAMYHDQGLPVLKARGFHRSVNITLGLPFIRTSVDHGTALDLAGRGVADAGSLCYATEVALDLIAKRTTP
nr:4-hydroxythreonine-4-phosphate dehydrogenase PdxA [Permianibacter fluminis]